MAVEVLFLSMILRKSALEPLTPDLQEIAQALFHWQPDWFREDEHLIATSFMAPMDVRAFGTALEQRTTLTRSRDWCVVDMATGPTNPCSWLGFRGGVGKLSGVWHEGTEPGELVRIKSLMPGEQHVPPEGMGVVKLFGRDSNHDAEGHREDFGRILPDWGGKDLWLLQRGAWVDSNGTERPAGYVSVERGMCDFNTLGMKPARSHMRPLQPDHPIFQEGPSITGVRKLK